ncbi:type IV toxin-antitoxin system AbiEi family antitoxin domain-containing protein [Ruania albidiflava]|uniref:type IV toxin-antitoxin system AbiEi family antitoxin domain-containing protein n=1 Tax=Ruania albidiflava TaxID=366586 RepID=UPI0003B793D7|nr:type IV toxin-antitoxin system AbiEi family antitoxin domain-containing protein [Ruania albidiflava]
MTSDDLLAAARATAVDQRGLISAQQCAQLGLSSDWLTSLVRRGQWQRVTRGVYDTTPGQVDRVVDPTAWRLRSVWLSLLAYGPDAIAVGGCALAMHGVWGLPIDLTPEAALPRAHYARCRDGIRLRRFDNGMTTTVVDGRRVATMDYALAQAIPEMARETAICVLDSALHLGLLRRSELRRVRHLVRGRRGAKRTHPWWALVDGRAQSPIETRARLIYHDVGLPPDTLQLPLLGARGQIVGYGDLAWRRPWGGWLVVEMDGSEYHSGPAALFRDRARQNEAVATGEVTMIRYTGSDLWRPEEMVSTVRSLLRAGPLAA